MENTKVTVNGDILTIEVDLSKQFGASNTGKSIIIASSKGIQPVQGAKESVSFGLNVFKKIK